MDMDEEGVKREYKPIRKQYVQIVKNSRNLCIGAMDNKGSRGYMETSRNLIFKHCRIRN